MTAQDVAEFFDELKDLPEDLQKSITSKFAKLSGLKQLTGETALQRDGARLDARQRAYYKKMGLDVPEDGEMITNILADNITIGEDPVIARRNIQDVAVDQDSKPQPQPAPQPPQPTPKPSNKVWQTIAAATIGTILAGGGGAWIGYLLRDPAPVVDKGGASFDFDTQLPKYLESNGE